MDVALPGCAREKNQMDHLSGSRMRMRKIAHLQAEIATGRYQVSARDLAEKLLRHMSGS